MTNWRVPEALLAVEEPVLYVEALFGQSIAEQFGLRLLEPPDDWLPRLPEEYRRRRVELTTLSHARTLPEPAFMKPAKDKSFPAKVYTGSELPGVYDENSPVLVSEIVTWEREYRCFVLNRRLMTSSIYLRHGELQRENGFRVGSDELDEKTAFVNEVLSDQGVDLPRTAVLDVGVIAGRGWAVVEQNSSWGAGIYGCDPGDVLGVLRFAAEPCGINSPRTFVRGLRPTPTSSTAPSRPPAPSRS